MDISISMQALKNLFSFPFRDPDWKNKFLIGSALAFAGMVIPVIPLLPVLGYYARVFRQGVQNESPDRLPAWGDWGDLFLDGLRVFCSVLLFYLPSLVVGAVGWTLYMGSVFGISFAAQRNSTAAGPGLIVLAAFAIFFISMAVASLLGILALLVMSPAQAHMLMARRFGALFEVGEWWRILRANFGGFLLALGVLGVLYFVILVGWQILYFTVILCLVTPLLIAPLTFYGGLVFYRLVGQAYGEKNAVLAPSATLPLQPVPGGEI